MTHLELLNKILQLVPDVKCSVHGSDVELKNIDDGLSTIHSRYNFHVVWNPLNTVPCPTETELNNV